MTTANVTKGPWIVRGDILEATVEKTDGELRSIIARCYGVSLCDEHGGDALSNAKLIAACPDLLDALKDMLSGWKYIREVYGDMYGVGWDRAQGKAEAAIAKAMGEA